VAPRNLDHLIDLSHQRHHLRLKALRKAAPASWDSRTSGWVGPVKDQSNCGSCWDFSGTGIIEIAYNKAGIGGGASTFILSEEYTLDCCHNGGCGGDDNTTVLAWAKTTGLPLTSAYGPYTGGSGFFRKCKFNSGEQLYKINDWGFADSNGGQGVTSTADIKAAIMEYGAVGCAIAADNAFTAWGDNNPSMASPFKGSGSTSVDHDVILIGWDDSTQSWILRNSWGTSWGVAGYMAISYGANLVGTEAVFALLDAPTPAPSPAPTPSPTPSPVPLPPNPVSSNIVINTASQTVTLPVGWTVGS
jgi:inhibitor of cysteine peptidase